LNTRGQLSFLQQALSLGPDAINFASTAPQPTTFTLDLPHPNKAPAAQVQNWHNLALIERLLSLAESESYDVVKEIFRGPLESCPELLLLKLAQLQVTLSALYCMPTRWHSRFCGHTVALGHSVLGVVL
jgi:hypothetical protein